MFARPLVTAAILAALFSLAACSGQVESAKHGNSLSEQHTVTNKGTGGR